MEEVEPQKRGLGCLVLSVALCAVAFGLYLGRPDIAYAFTVYPPWTYAVGGLAVAVVGRPKPFWRAFRWALAAWILFAAVFSEETLSVFRGGEWPTGHWNVARKQGRALRVVSLNCAGGDPLAAAEVAQFDPDIVLLQESPSREEVGDLARKLYGPAAGVVWGPDGSILTRTALSASALPKGTSNFVGAAYRTPEGLDLYVISLRLTPPVLRFDYWNPASWKDYAANLQIRRNELREIASFAMANRGSRPLIMGGDFNAGPAPQLANAMPLDMRDSFASAGRGWPYTAVNEWPLVRIDQIWTSRGLNPDAVFAMRTVNSDHRMVVCDLIVDTRK